MTLSEAQAHLSAGVIGGDDRDVVATARRLVGEAAAVAVSTGSAALLERAARIAGTYRALVDAATAAGVDRDDLEEALARL